MQLKSIEMKNYIHILYNLELYIIPGKHKPLGLMNKASDWFWFKLLSKTFQVNDEKVTSSCSSVEFFTTKGKVVAAL